MKSRYIMAKFLHLQTAQDMYESPFSPTGHLMDP